MTPPHGPTAPSPARAPGIRPGRPSGALLLDNAASRLLYGFEGLAEIATMTDLVATIAPRELGNRLAELADVEVLFTGWGCPRIDATILAAAPRLRAIFFAGGSIRSWITEAVWDRHLAVVSAYSVNAIPVADYTIAAVLFSLKRGWHYIGQQHRERRYPAPVIPGPGIYRTTVGLISLGAVGRLVCDRLRPFDVEIIAYDPFVNAEQAAALGVRLVGLQDVFKESDVVSLHAPLLATTMGMITGAHLSAMKPGATFINTSRGALVREAEMIELLRIRPDLTAVLDVLAEEPPAASNPLATLPNVFLTPHIAGSLGAECLRMGNFVLNQYRRWRRGEPMEGSLTRENSKNLA